MVLKKGSGVGWAWLWGVLLLMRLCRCDYMEKPFLRGLSETDFSALLRLEPLAGLILGMILTIVGSSLMACGSTLMKLGLHLEEEKRLSQASLAVPSFEPAWWSGFGAYSFGAGLHIVALGFAPASVLAPMNSIGLIANAIAAATILKEQFGWKEAVTTAGTILGVSLCAVASLFPHEEKMEVNSLMVGLASWRDPWYLSYLAFCLACGFGGLIYVNSEEASTLEARDREIVEMRQMQRRGSGVSPNTKKEMLDFPETQPLNPTYHSTDELSPCAEEDYGANDENGENVRKYPKAIGLSYGFLAGLVGSQCVLEVKELVCCFQYGLEKPEIYNMPQPYMCASFLLVTIWLQIHFLNLGLARGDATVVVPTYYIFWTLFGTFGGFSKFRETDGFSNEATCVFCVGFLVTVLCIAVLAIQEMTVLRKFVDDRIPDMPESMMDLATQDIQDQQLGSKVTLAMGLFPVSMLGRTVGRSRFRPIYHSVRRTRSTASDTAIADNFHELIHEDRQIGPSTLPHSLHFGKSQFILH